MPVRFEIGSAIYYLYDEAESSAFQPNRADLGPATILHHHHDDNLHVTTEWLLKKAATLSAFDDVFSHGFLSNVYFLTSFSAEESLFTQEDVTAICTTVKKICAPDKDTPLIPEGPYYVRDGFFHRVMRMYPDGQEAFFVATFNERQNPNNYHKLPFGDGRISLIGVPSRCYYPPDPSKPLNGLRISIKDNIDLKGLRTSLSSRAWHELYPEKMITAPSIQELLDLGAIVVGKTKMTQFAETEYPTADWVDYHCPFNPRGDGYLTPEGSTSGGAASLAAYSWLDVSVGTDTGGSLREPASKQGLFGIRPTYGIKSLEYIFPLTEHLDTIGFLTRDVHLLHAFSSKWFIDGRESFIKGLPTRILYLSEYEYEHPEAQEIFDRFVSQVEGFLGIERTILDLERTWKQSDPAGDGKSILEYIGKPQTMKNIKNLDLWNNTQKFRDEYAEKTGKTPYVNPAIRLKWEEASRVSPEAQREALNRKAVFKHWFEQHILKSNSKSDGPDTMLILPLSDPIPEYRDEYAEPWVGGSGFHRNFISSLSGCPEVMIPIGQTGYKSVISGRKEYLPAVASFLGPKGSDATLTQLAKDLLVVKRLPTSVTTGSTAFAVPELAGKTPSIALY